MKFTLRCSRTPPSAITSLDNYARDNTKASNGKGYNCVRTQDSYFSTSTMRPGIMLTRRWAKIIECNTEQSGRRVVCKDKSQDFGVYKYTVNVVGPCLRVPL